MSNYGTLAAFKTYHNARNNDYSTFSDDQISAALLIASEYIDGTYGPRFSGYKAGLRNQVREWPRIGSTDVEGNTIEQDEIPDEIERATYESAFKHLSAPGTLAVDFKPSKYTQASVQGAVSVTYANLNSSSAQNQFVAIERILSPLIGQTNHGSNVISGISTR